MKARVVVIAMIMVTITLTVVTITLTTRMGVSKNWSMSRHDPANTGYTDVEGPDDNHVLWTFKVEISEVWKAPAVVDGKVFVPEVGTIIGNYLYCLDARDGRLIWKKEIGSNASAPSVVGGRIYIGGGYDNQVHAFNVENGEQIWSYTLREPALGESPTVVDGKVFFPTHAELYCLDADTGELIWKNDRGRGRSVAVAENRIYGGDPFYCLGTEDGKRIWKEPINLGHTIHSIPVVANGKVYVSGDKFYALDAKSGEEVWNYSCPALIERAPAVTENGVLIPTEGGLHCLDATTGGLRWKFEDVRVRSSPIVAGNKVYTGYSRGLCALSLENGEMLWSYWGNEEEFWLLVVGGLSVADGKLFVGSHSGHVVCFGSPEPAQSYMSYWLLTLGFAIIAIAGLLFYLLKRTH